MNLGAIRGGAGRAIGTRGRPSQLGFLRGAPVVGDTPGVLPGDGAQLALRCAAVREAILFFSLSFQTLHCHFFLLRPLLTDYLSIVFRFGEWPLFVGRHSEAWLRRFSDDYALSAIFY